jgi:hypothetical protein
MNFDTPLVEYLIIGMHTSTWISIILLKVLKIPVESLLKVDATLLLLLLPFIYIIGMVFDDITFRILSSRISQIKKNVFGNSEKYQDEKIAYRSEILYNAYEARVRRVRIIGAAILNWPLLGASLVVYLGPANPLLSVLAGATVVLTMLSWYIWNGLNKRAYKFRKNAIDVIEEKTNTLKSK